MRRRRRGHALRRRYGRSTGSVAYHYGIWGEKPGWGYQSGQVFGHTPREAALQAIEDAQKWGPAKYKAPAKIHLQKRVGHTLTSEYHSFHLSPSGALQKIDPIREGGWREVEG